MTSKRSRVTDERTTKGRDQGHGVAREYPVRSEVSRIGPKI